MKHELTTEIDIAAPRHTVWSILTDLDQYSVWNPFIVSARGTVATGERLTNRMSRPGGKAMTFKPTVTAVTTDRNFEWLGHLGFPGIFDGRHRFELTDNHDGSTHLAHSEQLSGLLVRILRKSLDAQTLPGFEAMNAALKHRAEAHQAVGL